LAFAPLGAVEFEVTRGDRGVYSPAPLEIVSYGGGWKNPNAQREKPLADLVSVCAVESEPAFAGKSRDGLRAAADVGCDKGDFVSRTVDGNQGTTRFRCTRSADFDYRAALVRAQRSAAPAALSFLDQGQLEEYRDELRETKFGRKWENYFHQLIA